ncbi:hypothetical protein HNY73_005640 [Argiope bruennichi]|uniref:Transposase IS30-like HTH domain-containing protein n=1 Tax=Argiope bruennichi TaxID=94029 RepID=A0A8T0FJL9_ARGBR|nr:hypothetical protein HNY73_005640 [Argiope bruennichi]
MAMGKKLTDRERGQIEALSSTGMSSRAIAIKIGRSKTVVNNFLKLKDNYEPEGVTNSIAQAIREIRREESNLSRQLFRICMRILKERQVFACECVFRLGYLNLRENSRKGVFLNKRKPETRYRMIKFNEVGQAEGFAANIFKLYAIRPLGEAHGYNGYNFNTMNLMTFAMLFEPYYPRRSENSEDNIDQGTGRAVKRAVEMMEIYRERDRQLEMALNRAHAFELLNREPQPLDHDDIVEIPEEERTNE